MWPMGLFMNLCMSKDYGHVIDLKWKLSRFLNIKKKKIDIQMNYLTYIGERQAVILDLIKNFISNFEPFVPFNTKTFFWQKWFKTNVWYIQSDQCNTSGKGKMESLETMGFNLSSTFYYLPLSQ